MKFSSRTLYGSIAVATFALLFTATPIQACEQDCRDGISKAFADSYKKEVIPIFDAFSTDLITSLYDGQNATKKVKDAVTSAVNSTVASQESSFVATLPGLVLDSIFNQAPVFKGDCNHPPRVKQPPRGTPWKLSDCKKMDYICGNPPSICHFMNKIVKPRNVKTIVNSLQSDASPSPGSNIMGNITKTARSAAKKAGLSGTQLDKFVTGIGQNAATSLKTLSENFARNFCAKKTCDKYDNQIKKLLLSFF